MDRLERNLAGRADVVRLNIHEPVGQAFTEALGFQYTPTFILFDSNGEEVWRSVGVFDPRQVTRQIDMLVE